MEHHGNISVNEGKILIYDFGTTALKTVLFDGDLHQLDSETREFHYLFPGKKQIELPAETYWEMLVDSTREIITRNRCQHSLELVSLTGQAETLIPVNRRGEPLRQAIVWLDNRADQESDDLSRRIDQGNFYRITGLTSLDPILPLAKLVWLKHHEHECFQQTDRFLLLRDFIIYRLSGAMVTDPSIASCSGCFNIRNRNWSDALLAEAGCKANRFCEIAPSDTLVGKLLPDVRELFGLKTDVLVMNGMLDQCASTIGAGNICSGILTETTGTVLAMCYTIDTLEALPGEAMIPVACHGLNNKYLLLPYSPTAGMILKWFKDEFCTQEVEQAHREKRDPYDLITAGIDPAAEPDPHLCLLPHFTGTLFPEIDSRACGVFYGLSLDTRKANMIRSILESVGFLLKESIEYLQLQGFPVSRLISLGGGARSRTWLSLKSSILEQTLTPLTGGESTARGCAFLAALRLGWVKGPIDLLRYVHYGEAQAGNPALAQSYRRKYQLYRYLFQALRPVFSRFG